MEPDFASVWSRVTGAASSETPDARLRRFLYASAQDAASLRSLLCQARDNTLRCQLAELHTEKLRQMKRLRAALFLLAGECECPKVEPVAAPAGMAAELKTLYEHTERAASDYRRAAAATDRPTLEMLYSSIADAEARHAVRLLEIAERLLPLSDRTAPS